MKNLNFINNLSKITTINPNVPEIFYYTFADKKVTGSYRSADCVGVDPFKSALDSFSFCEYVVVYSEAYAVGYNYSSKKADEAGQNLLHMSALDFGEITTRDRRVVAKLTKLYPRNNGYFAHKLFDNKVSSYILDDQFCKAIEGEPVIKNYKPTYPGIVFDLEAYQFYLDLFYGIYGGKSRMLEVTGIISGFERRGFCPEIFE